MKKKIVQMIMDYLEPGCIVTEETEKRPVEKMVRSKKKAVYLLGDFLYYVNVQ